MNLTLRRHALGVLSLTLLAAALALWLFSEGNQAELARSLCLRSGLTLGALWLALPQILPLVLGWPPRLIVAVVVGGLAVLVRPRLFPIVLPVVAAVGLLEAIGWFLKPESKRPRKKM
jgi:hypothetical protein